MCPNGAIGPAADCCFSELALCYILSQTNFNGIEQSGHHHQHIEAMISFGVKQQSRSQASFEM
jgi:hypothetical protein